MSPVFWKYAKCVEFIATMSEFLVLGLIMMTLSRISLSSEAPDWFQLQYVWLTIEFCITFAYILSIICYMFVRFFTNHELLLTERSLKSHPKIDFVDAHYANTNLLGSSLAPLLISLFEVFVGEKKIEGKDPGLTIMRDITLLQTVQVVLIYCVVFISSEKRRSKKCILPTAWMLFFFALVS